MRTPNAWLLCAILGSGAVGAAPSVAAAADARYLTYTGIANAKDAERFLYGETHFLEYVGDTLLQRLVLYTCRDGTPFARKRVAYSDPLVPDFSLIDASIGMRQGIRADAGKRTVFFKDDASSPEKSAALPAAADLVADSGFDEFIHAHWQSLLAGGTPGIAFLLPSRLRALNFRIEHVRGERSGGVALEMFRLKLTGLLGLIVPSIDVYYDAGTRTLVRFVGLSDLRDASSDNYRVDIVFKPQDRKASSAEAFAQAAARPVAACR